MYNDKRTRSVITLLALGLAAGGSWAGNLVATWTKKAPLEPFRSATSPGPRAWTSMDFDSLNGKLMLFGGSASGFVADIWQYDTVADQWTAIENPADHCPGTFGFSGPDGRDTQVTIYDDYNHLYWSLSGGGYKCTGTRATMRTAQAGTNTTTVVDSSLPSDVTSDHFKDWTVATGYGKAYVQSYDSITKTLTLASPVYGLAPGSTYQIKVWTDGGSWYYSPVTRQWAALQLAHYGYTGPTPHVGYGSNTPAAAYSTADKAIVMFGGSINGVSLNETWVLDARTKTWALKKPNAEVGPYKRNEISSGMVYDSVNDVFILYGGRCDGSDTRCPGGKGPLGDTWAYKLSTNTWTQMITPVSPPARMGHQMSFDKEHGVVVMHGGTSVRDFYATVPTTAELLADTWIYDFAKNTWTEVTPAVSPPARYLAMMAFDPIAKVSVLYGGREPGQSIQGSVWHLSLADSDSTVNQAPQAAFSVSPATGSLNTTFAFDASTSRDIDGSIVSYAWNFGDGSGAEGATASHRYAAAGTYTVLLTVTDDRGESAQKSINVVVTDKDVTPDAFSFASATNVALNSWVVSAPATIAGIDAAAPIQVTGGEYSLDGGAFTSAPGTVLAGQVLRVRVMSANTNSTTRGVTVVVGGFSASFNTTTVAASGDVKPFVFNPESNAALNTLVSSGTATITVTGPTPISVVGGEYSISGGAFTSAAGTVTNGQGVRVRLLSSTSFGSTKTAVVTVGSLSVPFNVTTMAEDITPDAFAFVPVPSAALNTQIISNSIGIWGVNTATPISIVGGEYSIAGAPYTSAPGTVAKGQTLRVRVNSAAAYGETTRATLTVGTVNAVFNVTTANLDTTPDAFAFPAVTGAALSTQTASAGVMIRGINGPTPISVTGGEYNINGGAFTSAAGTVLSGQTVRVRQLSSSSYGATNTTVLNIGGVTAGFAVTTSGVDTTPAAFSFAGLSNVDLGVWITSPVVVVTGINAPTPISVTGGEYSINGAAFTSAPGMVNNAQSVRVRVTSSSQHSTASTVSLNVGGVSGSFTAVTAAPDTEPLAFTFLANVSALPNTVVVSESKVVAGINTATSISVVGGEYSIAGGAFTSVAGSITKGQSVRVRLTTGPEYQTSQSVTLTVGSYSTRFDVTTAVADRVPTPFSFDPISGVLVNTAVTSSTRTVNGINAPTPISIEGGEYSISGAAFTSAPGTVLNGQGIRVRVISSSAFVSTKRAVVTIGGVSGNFDVTTVAEDPVPDAFAFTEATNVTLDTWVSSSSAGIWGINTAAPVSVENGEYSIAGAAFTSVPGTITKGQSIRVRVRSSNQPLTTATATLNIGGFQVPFKATTRAQ